MSIEEQIVDWVASRPVWQQLLLQQIAAGQYPDSREISSIVDRLVTDQWSSSQPIKLEDIPRGSSRGESVCVLRISDVQHVNALLEGQELELEESGLTIIYGDNGSGKSGYARLLKSIVRARTKDDVLTNVFSDSGEFTPEAQIGGLKGGEAFDLAWPSEGDESLSQILFYDEACGDAYVSTEGDIGYRPYAMFLFDGLIRACDDIRSELDRCIFENEKSTKQLPVVAQNTPAAEFLSALSDSTTDAELSAACKVPSDVEEKLKKYAAEEARLFSIDPSKERKRLTAKEEKLKKLLMHFNELQRVFSESNIATLKDLQNKVLECRKAAEVASKRSFENEPLAGVGTTAWKELWNAARRYATEYAYPDDDYPKLGDESRCVLCHQELSDEASDRLERFEAFVRDETQRVLNEASQEWKKAADEIRIIEHTPTYIASILEDLAEDYADLTAGTKEALGRYKQSQDSIVANIEQMTWTDVKVQDCSPLLVDLDKAITAASELVSAVDTTKFDEDLKEVQHLRSNLQAAKTLHDNKDTIALELERRREYSKLRSAKEGTNTQGISKKATELTREHVTSVVRDRFTRESDRLMLERVTLEDIGGRKGSLRHQPSLVGAIQDASLTKVLSEGEQTALGLAGFFTEAFFDSSKSAMILDDPVSSLDHIRRKYVANRLTEFAKDRQVIVFTHDIAFVIELRVSAEAGGVALAERSIERLPSGEPGVCRGVPPWKAKDVEQRLHELDIKLAAIRRDYKGWDQDRYERECSEWAGKLSETWERTINHEVVGQVVDRGTQEVRPRLFRLLAQISEDDDKEFQASYGRCSRWVRRHDKSAEMNYSAPKIKEMEDELLLVRGWVKRVKKYRSRN